MSMGYDQELITWSYPTKTKNIMKANCSLEKKYVYVYIRTLAIAAQTQEFPYLKP